MLRELFSGGPNSVDEKYAPKVPKFIYDLKIPIFRNLLWFTIDM